METGELVRYIERHPGCTQKDLSSRFGISQRTVRAHVKRANNFLSPAAHLELRRGRGYRLHVVDSERFSSLDLYSRERSGTFLARTRRVEALAMDLLMRDEWVTFEALGAAFFISRSVLIRDLARVGEMLRPYGLVLKRRPHYGVRVEGAEFHRRQCMVARVVSREVAVSHEEPVKVACASAALRGAWGAGFETSARIIDDLLRETLTTYDLYLQGAGYRDVLAYCLIAALRSERGRFVSDGELDAPELSSTTLEAARQIIADSRGYGLPAVPPDEERALALMMEALRVKFASRQPLEGDASDARTADAALDRIKKMLLVDFSHDECLHQMLARHLAALDLRLAHHIRLVNRDRDCMRETFPLVWIIATAMVAEEAERMGVTVPADEVTNLIPLFVRAIDVIYEERLRRRVLILSAQGEGEASVLAYRLRQVFGSIIERMTVSDEVHLTKEALDDVDLVISTAPTREDHAVPMSVVDPYLPPDDIARVSALLTGSQTRPMDTPVFTSMLFLPHLKGKSKEEVLDQLCEKMTATLRLEPEFTQAVKRREESVSTAFGGGIAIPHALSSVVAKTAVCVGVLDRPVAWSAEGVEVQLVLLIAFREHDPHSLDAYIRVLEAVALDRHLVKKLVGDPRWETFQHLVVECAEKTPSQESISTSVVRRE